MLTKNEQQLKIEMEIILYLVTHLIIHGSWLYCQKWDILRIFHHLQTKYNCNFLSIRIK